MQFVLPTGWSSKETTQTIKEKLKENDFRVLTSDINDRTVSSRQFSSASCMAGVVDSVVTKVAQLAMRKAMTDRVILTGGLSHRAYFTRRLSKLITWVRFPSPAF